MYFNEKYQEFSKKVRGPLAFYIQQILDEQKGLNLLHPFRNVGTLQIEQGFEDIFTFFNSELNSSNEAFRSFFFEKIQDNKFLEEATK